MKQNNGTKRLEKRSTIIRSGTVISIFVIISILLLSSFQPVLRWDSPLLSAGPNSIFRSVTPPLSYEANDPKVINWRLERSEAWGTEICIENSRSIYAVGDIEYYPEDGFPQTHLLLSKWDSNGTPLWYRIWGDVDCEVRGSGVAVDNIGNVYTPGCFACPSDYSVLVKWDAEGNQVWNRTWNGWFDYHGRQNVIVGSDGNIYITGSSSNGLLLTKWNTAGNQMWNRTWKGDSSEGTVGIAIDYSDGHIYTIGYDYNQSESLEFCYFLVKWDITGNQVWNRTLGNFNEAFWTGLAVDTDGNVYTTGTTNWGGVTGDEGFVLLKWDAAGNQLWSQTGEAGCSDAKITMGGVNNSIYTMGGQTLSYKSTRGVPMEYLTVLMWDTKGNLLGSRTSGDYGLGRGIDISNDGTLCTIGFSGTFPNHTLQLVIYSPSNFLPIPPESTPGFAIPIVIFTIFLLSFLNKRRRRIY